MAMKRQRSNHRRRRGFLAIDAVMALAIVMILTMALTVAVTRQNLASQKLAETRAAMRLAEATMIALQTGQTPPAAPTGASVRVQRLDAPGEVPRGCAWTTITVTLNGRATDVTGIVRADAIKEANQ